MAESETASLKNAHAAAGAAAGRQRAAKELLSGEIPEGTPVPDGLGDRGQAFDSAILAVTSFALRIRSNFVLSKRHRGLRIG